jgi:hypothetical protein
MKPWLLIGIAVILAACGSPQVSTPAPTPEAIYLFYPPSLQPWADRLSNCADNNSLIGLYFFPISQPPENLQPDQVLLTLSPSETEIKSASLYQVGREQVVVIINQDNPLTNLSSEELRSIFSGQEKTWPVDGGQPVQVWVLPESDQVSTIFNQSVMMTIPVTTDAKLAPDPVAMLEAVSGNTDAIGYLPASFLNSSGSVDPGTVSIVQLNRTLTENLSQPVVAVTQGEPNGQLRSLLACMESSSH